ncbi:MAG: glycine zipper domain-containing protein [Devosia sp.]|jgi:surface antigen|nr:glycine zipper domain-containing protein [Devosiaceae bacterium]
MHKFLIIAAATLSLTACTTTEQGAGIGAVTGGLLGAASTGTVAGAAVGAGVGAVAGAVIGHVAGEDGYCWYQPDHRHRHRWKAVCPGGY